MQRKLNKEYLYAVLAVIGIMIAALAITLLVGKATKIDNETVEGFAITKITELTNFSEEEFKKYNYSSLGYDELIRSDIAKDIYFEAQEEYVNNVVTNNHLDIKSFRQDPFNGNIMNWEPSNIKINKIDDIGADNYGIEFDLDLSVTVFETIPGDFVADGTTKMNGKIRFKDLSIIVNLGTEEISVPEGTLDKLGQFSLMWNRSFRIEPTIEEVEYVPSEN